MAINLVNILVFLVGLSLLDFYVCHINFINLDKKIFLYNKGEINFNDFIKEY